MIFIFIVELQPISMQSIKVVQSEDNTKVPQVLKTLIVNAPLSQLSRTLQT